MLCSHSRSSQALLKLRIKSSQRFQVDVQATMDVQARIVPNEEKYPMWFIAQDEREWHRLSEWEEKLMEEHMKQDMMGFTYVHKYTYWATDDHQEEGYTKYIVNLDEMTQENEISGTKRRLFRVNANK